MKCPSTAPRTVARIRYACIHRIMGRQWVVIAVIQYSVYENESNEEEAYVVCHEYEHEEEGEEDLCAVEECSACAEGDW